MERLIGFVRSGGTLTAHPVRQADGLDFETREAAIQSAGIAPWHEIVALPLASLEAGGGASEALSAAWDALGQVRTHTAAVREALRTVLAETVCGLPVPGAAPPLLPLPARRVRPTAAHPRAYQGTTDKPPSKKLPLAADLRPALCRPARLGLLPENEEAALAAEARLPLLFRTSLFPLLRGLPGAELGAYLALFRALALDRDPARLAAFAWLVSLDCGPNTAAWGWLAAALPPTQQTPLLGLLIASGASAVSAADLPPLFAEHLEEALGGRDPLHRAYHLLHGLTVGIAPDYLRAGFFLADAYMPDRDHSFDTVRQSGHFPLPTAVEIEAHCRGDEGFYPGMLLRLWEQCGLYPGLGEAVEKMPWTRYAPEVACRCLRLYIDSWNCWDELSERQAAAKWEAVRPFLGGLEAALESVSPEFQGKFLWHLYEYLWQWDTPAELNAHLPSALALTRRLCRPPFAKNADPSEVLTDFLAEMPRTLRLRFLEAPDASFRRLEDACRRENDTWRIGRGTWALTRQAGEFTVQCFETCPAALFQAAKLLGSLPGPVREKLVRELDPVLSGLEARAGLKALEQETLRTLAGRMPAAEGSAARHALQMQALVTDNRRALRKLLEAHWRGQTDYRQAHPLTRRWLARHPRLDPALWLRGIAGGGTADGWGVLTIAVESDPLEALKLGTYVGSCLGLGGDFAYSAAAAVLDINKQVVYARDRRGTVVGRQLVAVSEDDCLVCFEVYPLGAQAALGGLFAAFDAALAAALGLPLHQPQSGLEYKIACILSHAWWDDLAWDLAGEKNLGEGDAQPGGGV